MPTDVNVKNDLSRSSVNNSSNNNTNNNNNNAINSSISVSNAVSKIDALINANNIISNNGNNSNSTSSSLRSIATNKSKLNTSLSSTTQTDASSSSTTSITTTTITTTLNGDNINANNKTVEMTPSTEDLNKNLNDNGQNENGNGNAHLNNNSNNNNNNNGNGYKNEQHNHHNHYHNHQHNKMFSSTAKLQTKSSTDTPATILYNAPPDRFIMVPITSRQEVDDGLGPLPPKWEKAYTENGEVYFIDHNTGTSHWLDPRLSKFQKKSLEDCQDDELPYGWEKIHDPQYGTYFIDHVNRRTQYENPVLEAKRRSAERQQQQQSSTNGSIDGLYQKHKSTPQPLTTSTPTSTTNATKPNFFTKNPDELHGERITTTLLKSSRGLGFTIVGGDDNIDEFLQIKSIVSNGPAWLDGKLQTGDILVYVNDTCVLGFTHHEMVNVFQSILPGETVTLEICRGYPLPFDPNDPNTEVVTTIAVDGINSESDKARILMDFNMDGNYNFLDVSDTSPTVATVQHSTLSKFESNSVRSDVSENYANETRRHFPSHGPINIDKPEILNISIMKGPLGFGFTIADSAYGQKVKEILDRNCCKNLQVGDYLLAINNTSVMYMSHSAVVQVLKNCPKSEEAILKIQRGTYLNGNLNDKANLNRIKRIDGNEHNQLYLKDNLYRSKTPTADLYSTQPKEILPTRSKTPLVDTRGRAKTPSSEFNVGHEEINSIDHQNKLGAVGLLAETKSINSFRDHDSINNEGPFNDTFPRIMMNLTERLADSQMLNEHQRLHSGRHMQQSIYQTNSKEQNILQGYDAVAQQTLNNFEQNSVSSDYYVNYNANTNMVNAYANSPNNSIYTMSANGGQMTQTKSPTAPVPTYHHDHCYCFECQDYGRHQQEYNSQIQHQYQQQQQLQQEQQQHIQKQRYPYGGPNRLQHVGFSSLDVHQEPNNASMQPHQLDNNYWLNSNQHDDFGYLLSEVTLQRQANGFGFRIVGGTEEGSQVAVGHIVPNGAADEDPRIATGDEILSIDGHNVVQSSHHRVVQLMGDAAQNGQVTMILRRRVQNPPQSIIQYPYDVIVTRNETEGFGFVIISASNQYYGSTIGKLIPGSPADRCDELKVGDRIIAVNGIDIAGMTHGDVVNLIKDSGLQVRLTIGNPKETHMGTLSIIPHNSTNSESYFDQAINFGGCVASPNDSYKKSHPN